MHRKFLRQILTHIRIVVSFGTSARMALQRLPWGGDGAHKRWRSQMFGAGQALALGPCRCVTELSIVLPH